MHILLADDHTLVREMLRDYLKKLYKDAKVTEASTFDEAFSAADKANNIDLVLLDYIMPGMKGGDSIRDLHSHHPGVPIAIISGTVRQSDIMTAMKNGARGVIPKTISGKSLAKAIDLILSGDTYIPSMLLDGAAISEAEGAAGAATTVLSGQHLKNLTRRELEVLALLVEGHPNKVIARELDIREVTVKVHLKNVFRKFGVSNRGQAIRAALLGEVKGALV